MLNHKHPASYVWFSIVVNLILAAVKFITGTLGNSFALIADGVESSSDVMASFLLLFALRYAYKPADKDHPYGHGKFEPVISILLSFLLLISAGWIIYQSIQNIQTPHQLPASFTLVVLALTILIKEVSFRYMKKGSAHAGSSALLADAWHHRSDAITSAAAFIGISISIILGPGYEEMDDWTSLLAAGVIIWNALLMARPAYDEIMDTSNFPELEKDILKSASKDLQLKRVEKCLIRKSGNRFFVDLHIEVSPALTVFEGHEIAHRVKDLIRNDNPQIADVLVHVEPYTVSE